MRYCFSHGKKAWFLNHINDPYVKMAQKQQFRSRAAFKIQQIETKYKILGKNILDLGSAPGSWSQMVKLLKRDSRVVAVDLLKMDQIQGVIFYHQDARSDTFYNLIKQNHQLFDTIISDMAPNFGGNQQQTHQEIIELNKLCVELSLVFGSQKSNLIMKSLYGQFEKSFYIILQLFFQSVHRFKPQASRKKSSEFYYVCKNRKEAKDVCIERVKKYKIKTNINKNDLLKQFLL